MKGFLAALATLVVLFTAGVASAETAPSYTLSAHCAGLTVGATDYPSGARLQVYTGKVRAGSVKRVDQVFTGALSKRVAFSTGTASNTYSVTITAPGVPTVLRRGTLTSCTPQYANQLPGVILPPVGW